MSATALLQKAAQIGSTRSNNNPSFFGTPLSVMASSSNNSVTKINDTQSQQVNIQAPVRHENLSAAMISSTTGGLGHGGSGGVSREAGTTRSSHMASLATPVSNINQLMTTKTLSSEAKSCSDTNQHKVRPNSTRVDNGHTRDFLGVGAGERNGRAILPQELANFVSMSSNMGLSHFGEE